MQPAQGPADGCKDIVVRLSSSDHAILEKFRGDLSADAFLSAVLRMIESGAVRAKPDWVRDEEAK
jgi:hypothetical protein